MRPYSARLRLPPGLAPRLQARRELAEPGAARAGAAEEAQALQHAGPGREPQGQVSERGVRARLSPRWGQRGPAL